MRPRSMTGFGRGEAQKDAGIWIAEVRTVNHRFLDMKINLPKGFVALEDKVRKLVSRHCDRGRMEICVQQVGTISGLSVLTPNLELATQYYNCLRQVNEELQLDENITLQDMLTLRDLIGQQEQVPDLDTAWEVVAQALDAALEECNGMREREGASLKDELLERLENFSDKVCAIEERIPSLVKQRQGEVQAKISKLLDGLDVDPARLAQEAAILADKSDVTEELVRLKSHINQFREFLRTDEPVGRRLDFLLQEFLREVNTVASKISNSEVAHFTVELKNEVEKLREQVQNIE